MNEYKYALRYTWLSETRDEGYTKEDAGDLGLLADYFLGISIVLASDGSYSQELFSINGKEKRSLTQKEIFTAWSMLGISLHDEGELKGWRADFVQMHSEITRSLFNHLDNCAVNKEK